MRILQLIDSLQIGGAEQIAVNYANSLASEIDKSYLCTTRIEGELKGKISDEVGYLFLDKRLTIDVKAIRKLYGFVKKNKIDIIHAHTTSFFLAALIKLCNRKVKVIWHDHNGNRLSASGKQNRILKYCSYFFHGVIVVNVNLKSWAEARLKVKQVHYLPNFSVLEKNKMTTVLKGNTGKRIICLANLRYPKNHMLLLKTFFQLSDLHEDWSLHLIGEDYGDSYSTEIHKFIKANNLNKKVYLYGLRQDIKEILEQAEIGVLCSTSEGLPLALLEYGLAKLAVIASNVGDCEKVITNSSEGLLIPSNDADALFEALSTYMKNKDLRSHNGEMLYNRIMNDFSKHKVIKSLVSIYTD